jgi:hypothetical protein
MDLCLPYRRGAGSLEHDSKQSGGPGKGVGKGADLGAGTANALQEIQELTTEGNGLFIIALRSSMLVGHPLALAIDRRYSERLAGEGEHWGNFIAKRLLEHNEIQAAFYEIRDFAAHGASCYNYLEASYWQHNGQSYTRPGAVSSGRVSVAIAGVDWQATGPVCR